MTKYNSAGTVIERYFILLPNIIATRQLDPALQKCTLSFNFQFIFIWFKTGLLWYLLTKGRFVVIVVDALRLPSCSGMVSHVFALLASSQLHSWAQHYQNDMDQGLFHSFPVLVVVILRWLAAQCLLPVLAVNLKRSWGVIAQEEQTMKCHRQRTDQINRASNKLAAQP